MIIYEPPVPHRCNTPSAHAYRIGTLFACDECKKVYELREDQRDGRYWGSKALTAIEKKAYGLD